MQCLANTRGMMQAQAAYWVDNKNRNVQWRPDGELVYWITELVDYGFGLDEKLCPEATTVDDANNFSGDRHHGGGNAAWQEDATQLPAVTNFDEISIASYGMNMWMYNYENTNPITITKLGYTEAEFQERASDYADEMRDPTEKPVFGDCVWRSSLPEISDTGASDAQRPWVPGVSPRTTIAQWQMDRHPSRSINLSFGDGHAESVNVDDLDQLLWHNIWPKDGSVDLDVTW